MVCVLDSSPHNYYAVVIPMFFFLGVSRAYTMLIGFLIMAEVAPEGVVHWIAASWLAVESLIPAIIAIYFRYISIDWIWIQVFGLGITFFALIAVTCWVPESPKWLYKQGKYQDCNIILKRMAKFNGIKETEEINKLLMINPNDFEKQSAKKPKEPDGTI